MTRGFAIAITLATISLISQSQVKHLDWVKADSLMLRLPPTAFLTLPTPIRHFLEKGGYTIPQNGFDTIPNNVISGNFMRPGQVDWAILASRDLVSSIFIFWGNSPDSVSELQREDDIGYLQTGERDSIVFSRMIETIIRPQVDSTCTSTPDLVPLKQNPNPHDAILHGFFPKHSSVLYWSDGTWYDCIGSD
jgi:hypothetical protein